MSRVAEPVLTVLAEGRLKAEMPDIGSAIAARVTYLVGASRSGRLLAEIKVEMLIDL